MDKSTIRAQPEPKSVSPSPSDDPNGPPRADNTSNERLAVPVDEGEAATTGNGDFDNIEYERLRKECDEMMTGPPKFTMSTEGNHWAACSERMKNSDNAACKAWGDDVDALLVFAGLFSAVVTAFAVESYQWLDVDSSDVTTAALLHISAQLSGEEQGTYTPDPFSPSSLSRRINSYWFLSLALALLSALLGILCKQWLREYQAVVPVPHQRTIAARQMRFDALHFWKVDGVLASLPLLLEAALILFFVGILELLWNRDRTVGIVIAVLCFVGLIIVLSTTVLPAIIFLLHMSHDVSHDDKRESIPPCAFKSPPSWLFLKAVIFVRNALCDGAPAIKLGSWYSTERRVLTRIGMFRYYTSIGLRWIDEQFSRHKDAVLDVKDCVKDLESWTFDASLFMENSSSPFIAHESYETTSVVFRFMLSKYEEHFVDDVPSNKYLAEILLHLQETSPLVMKQWSQLAWDIEMQVACVRILAVTMTSYGACRDLKTIAFLGPILRFSLTLPFSSFEARSERNRLFRVLVETLREYLAGSNDRAAASARFAIEEAILNTLSSHRIETGIPLRHAVTDWAFWVNREGRHASSVLRCFSLMLHCLDDTGLSKVSPDWQVLVREVQDLELTHHLQNEATSEGIEQALNLHGVGGGGSDGGWSDEGGGDEGGGGRGGGGGGWGGGGRRPGVSYFMAPTHGRRWRP